MRPRNSGNRRRLTTRMAVIAVIAATLGVGFGLGHGHGSMTTNDVYWGYSVDR
jgi:hypothetical protein